MICKAIIESKVSKYKYKVSVPAIIEGTTTIGAMPNQGIPTATVSIPPGVYPSLRSGDVVLVCFEDDNIFKPIIVGVLFTENCTNISCDIQSDSLKVKVNSELPENTSIGKVTKDNIKNLEGLEYNVQSKFQEHTTKLKFITNNDKGIFNTILNELNTSISNNLKDWKEGELW